MTPRPLAVLLVSAAAFAAPLQAAAQTTETHTFNQEGKHNKKDMKKAEDLSEGITGWDKLSPEEQQAVLQAIAIDVHGRRRKVSSAMIQVKKGKDLNAKGDNFEGKKTPKTLETGGFQVVYSEQDKAPVAPVEEPTLEEIPILPVQAHDVFKDNSWELSAAGEQEIKDGIARAFAAFDKVKAKNPKANAKIGGIHIAASASTVFNNAYANPSDKSTRLTHRQLSRARANSINRLVRRELAGRGVIWDKVGEPADADFSYADEDESDEESVAKGRQIFTDSAGNNGNGTSGPNSPYNCPTWLIPGGDKDAGVQKMREEFAAKFCVDGDGPAPDEAKAWAEAEGKANAKQDTATAKAYGKKIEDAYREFRYVNVTFDGVAQVEGTTKTEGQNGKAHIVLVKVNEKTHGKTKGWKVVKFKQRRSHDNWFFKMRCGLGIVGKKNRAKCPIPCPWGD